MDPDQKKLLSPLAKPSSYARYFQAIVRYFPHPGLRHWKGPISKVIRKGGHSRTLRGLFNAHQGKRCFVVGNGPSLKKLDLNLMRDDVVIGSNGIYKLFSENFRVDYLLLQDQLTIAKKAEELNQVRGIQKLVALQASHLVKPDPDTLYFNLATHLGWSNMAPDNQEVTHPEFLPQFSNNFSQYATHMGNVSHTALQFAFFMGCNPIYLIGCDHSHNTLSKQFPPGHILITEENIHLFNNSHFTQNYYKVGDYIGIPFYDMETEGYRTALKFIESSGRQLLNAGVDSLLDFIPRVSYESLF